MQQWPADVQFSVIKKSGSVAIFVEMACFWVFLTFLPLELRQVGQQLIRADMANQPLRALFLSAIVIEQ